MTRKNQRRNEKVFMLLGPASIEFDIPLLYVSACCLVFFQETHDKTLVPNIPPHPSRCCGHHQMRGSASVMALLEVSSGRRVQASGFEQDQEGQCSGYRSNQPWD
jgi:hypothetical protein